MKGGLSSVNTTSLLRCLSRRVPAGFMLAAALLLASCNKEPQPGDTLRMKKDDPAMSARNIEVIFSDSGRIQAKLSSRLMNRYLGEQPHTEFPEGFKIFIFDSVQQVTATITGDRGSRKDNLRMMEAWGNVVVRNELKNEQMNTEHLIWDENRHRIWTDVKVKITRPDQVLYGSSMESNEAFTSYSIKDPTGEFAVKKDSL
jgi:LPS export ABC transporter protein LptC